MSKALIRMESDVRGTFGYLDPENVQTNYLSEKSDVYSFGVLLLEVLCGRGPIEPYKVANELVVVGWACECIKNRTIYNIIDPHLKGKIAPECFKQFVEIAFSCLKVSGNERPSMGEVEMTLELALELQNKADSEIERINPHGECVYEDVIFCAPHFCYGVKPLQSASDSIV
ncbi:hypothetical protein COLO4_03897 [Corchorus olitorius]|uniref:Protein kinase domain-containing protein n=1 Tax=Corchorus olitorius TaxID=93759 RepID=A0A1R3KW65_9ROSI|nr:hypothetical protein COLO4_03897 [Corchorus olitorius]